MTMFRPALVLALAVAAGSAWGQLPWLKSWQEASKRAQAGGSLVMIEFQADWCGVCRQMQATTLKDKSVAQAAKGLVPLTLDGEKGGRTLAARYEVRGFPSFIFVDARGEEFGRFVGGIEASGFVQIIKEMQARHRDFKAMSQRVAKNRSDGPAFARLAQINAQRGKVGAALPQAKRAQALRVRGLPMAKAWLSLGEAAQRTGQLEAAVQRYLLATQSGGGPQETAFGFLMASAISLDLRRPADARKYAAQLKKVKGAPARMLQAADQIVAEAKKIR